MWGADAGVNPRSLGQDTQQSYIWATLISAGLSGLLNDIIQGGIMSTSADTLYAEVPKRHSCVKIRKVINGKCPDTVLCTLRIGVKCT